MKRTFFAFLLLLLLHTSANCQTKKGTWTVGGEINYRTKRTIVDDPTNSGNVVEGTQKFRNFYLQPKAAYFFKDWFAGGIIGGLGFQNSVNVDEVGNVYKTHSYSVLVGPVAQFYLLNPASKINVMFEPSAQLVGSSSSKQWTQQYRLAAGPVFFLTENTAVTMLPGFTHRTQPTDRPNQLEWTVGLQMFL